GLEADCEPRAFRLRGEVAPLALALDAQVVQACIDDDGFRRHPSSCQKDGQNKQQCLETAVLPHASLPPRNPASAQNRKSVAGARAGLKRWRDLINRRTSIYVGVGPSAQDSCARGLGVPDSPNLFPLVLTMKARPLTVLLLVLFSSTPALQARDEW